MGHVSYTLENTMKQYLNNKRSTLLNKDMMEIDL
jgi:hypothetical protein